LRVVASPDVDVKRVTSLPGHRCCPGNRPTPSPVSAARCRRRPVPASISDGGGGGGDLRFSEWARVDRLKLNLATDGDDGV